MSHATPWIIQSTPQSAPSIYTMSLLSLWYTKSVSSTFKQRLALTLGAKQNQREAKQW